MRTTGFIACLCLFLAQTPICVAAVAALDGTCDNSTEVCNTTDPHLICDLKPSPPVCKFDVGGNCAAGADKCATGLTCPANHVCAAHVSATNIAVGVACAAGDTCATGLVCDAAFCKNKVGTTCTSTTPNCVDGAECTGTPLACACVTGRTLVASNGTCAAHVNATNIAVGQACAPGDTCARGLVCNATSFCTVLQGGPGGACTPTGNCTDPNSECVTKACQCKSGFQVNTADYTCKSGSTTVMASIVLILLAALTSRLV